MAQAKKSPLPRQFSVVVGDRGRFVLPREVREFLSVEEGDTLTVVLEEDGSARLVSLKEQVKHSTGLFAHVKRSRRLVDELLKERREETSGA